MGVYVAFLAFGAVVMGLMALLAVAETVAERRRRG